MGRIREEVWQHERSASQRTHVRVCSYFLPSNPSFLLNIPFDAFSRIPTPIKWMPLRSQVVIDGWILLQVARRIDSPSDSGSTSGGNGIASDVALVQPAVDYQLARRKGKLFFSDVSIDMIASISPLNHRGHVHSGSPILNPFFFHSYSKRRCYGCLGSDIGIRCRKVVAPFRTVCSLAIMLSEALLNPHHRTVLYSHYLAYSNFNTFFVSFFRRAPQIASVRIQGCRIVCTTEVQTSYPINPDLMDGSKGDQPPRENR